MFAVSGSASSVTIYSTHASVLHNNIVETSGNSVNLSCASDIHRVPLWDYYPYKSSRPTHIYNRRRKSERLDSRFLLDPEGCFSNKCVLNLRIENLQLKDAGRFVCLQRHSVGRNSYMSLTVLGQYKTAVLFSALKIISVTSY